MRVYIVKGKGMQPWYVKLIGANNKTLSVSEGYASKWNARRAAKRMYPNLPIVDPHHHLWDRPGWRYMLDDLLADINAGHNIVATVFVQCRAFHRAAGPEAMQPVGETEFVNGVAAMSASGGYGPTKICAGIVGHADLRNGAATRDAARSYASAGTLLR